MNKISKYFLTSFFATSIFFVSNACAEQDINFEDLDLPIDSAPAKLQDGHAGFYWNSATSTVGATFFPNSGFQRGTTGNTSIANDPAIDNYISFASITSETFTLNQANITKGLGEDELHVRVEALKYNSTTNELEPYNPPIMDTIKISDQATDPFTFTGFKDIDAVKFTPITFLAASIVIDNIIINASTTIDVTIDIKPGNGDEANSINACSRGAFPVAVFGSMDFDVNDIDTESLKMADNEVKTVGKKYKELCSYEDVDNDGYTDLVCHFITVDLASEDGTSTSVNLTGKTKDGDEISGSDKVYIVKDCE